MKTGKLLCEFVSEKKLRHTPAIMYLEKLKVFLSVAKSIRNCMGVRNVKHFDCIRNIVIRVLLLMEFRRRVFFIYSNNNNNCLRMWNYHTHVHQHTDAGTNKVKFALK